MFASESIVSSIMLYLMKINVLDCELSKNSKQRVGAARGWMRYGEDYTPSKLGSKVWDWQV